MKTIVFLILLISNYSVFAAPAGLTFQGRLVHNSSPVESALVNLTLKVTSPSAPECVLYEELHTLNMTNSDGIFTVKIGGGSRTSNDEGLTLSQVFSNSGTAVNGLSCSDGSTTSFTPATGDSRKVYVTFTDGVDTVAFSSPYVIQSVPYALEAEKLAGKEAGDFIQVSGNVTQTKLNNLLATASFNELTNLVSGTSAQYMTSSSTEGALLPVLSSTPGTLSAGKVWYEGGTLKYYDGSSSTVKTVGTSTESIQVTANTTQAKVNALMVPATYTELINLIGGVSTQYMSSSSTEGALLPVLSSTPGTLTAGKVWYEGGELKYTDGSTVKTVSTATDALQVTANTTQAKLNTLMVPATYTELTSLIGGSSTQYMPFSLFEGTTVPTVVGGPLTPAAGKLWFESGSLKFYDGSTTRTLGTSTGSLQTTTDTTQAKLNTLMVPATYTELTSLAAGTSSKYVTSSTTEGTLLPVLTGAPATLTAGKFWYEGGVLKFYDGSSTKALSTTTGTVTSIIAGTGLSGGTITGSGTLSLESGVIATPGTYKAVTVDTYGRVIAGANPTTLAGYGITDALSNGGNATGANMNIGATDNFGLSLLTNNTARLNILNSGNVGIGTATPDYLLNVQKSSGIGVLKVTGVGGNEAGYIAVISNTGVQQTGALQVNNSSSGLARVIQANASGANNIGYAVQAINNSANGWGIYSSGTSSNYFNGSVGIGTATPASKLEVTGDITLTSGATRTISVATPASSGTGNTLTLKAANGFGGCCGNGTGAQLDLYGGNNFGDGGNILLRAGTGGNGHAGGTVTLEGGLSSSSGAQVIAEGGVYNSNGKNLTLLPGAKQGTGITDGNVLIASTRGHVAIGTSSAPQAKLDVVDTSTTTSAIIVPRAAAFTGTAVNGMIRYNSTSALFEFYQNGAWVNFTTVSDGRLKTNVIPVENGLEIVNQLNPVYYDWDKSHPRTQSFPEKQEIGFIAQEVEEVLPEVVNKGSDGYRSVEYGKMVSVAIAAIKELWLRIQKSEEKNASLKREVAGKVDKRDLDELKTQNAQLKKENAEIKAYICSKDPKAVFCN